MSTVGYLRPGGAEPEQVGIDPPPSPRVEAHGSELHVYGGPAVMLITIAELAVQAQTNPALDRATFAAALGEEPTRILVTTWNRAANEAAVVAEVARVVNAGLAQPNMRSLVAAVPVFIARAAPATDPRSSTP